MYTFIIMYYTRKIKYVVNNTYLFFFLVPNVSILCLSTSHRCFFNFFNFIQF